ncbi:hypothetical protein ACSBOB_20085 [Mesorhizobium sp. ASY16-5R]
MFAFFFAAIAIAGLSLNMGFKDGQTKPDARNFFDSRPKVEAQQ